MALLGLAMMRSAELRRTPPAPRGKGQIRESVRYLAGVRVLRIARRPAGDRLPRVELQPTPPLLVKRALHGSDGEFTLVLSMFSVGGVVWGWWWPAGSSWPSAT